MIDIPVGLLQTSRVSPQELSRTTFWQTKKGDDDHWPGIICSTIYAPQRNCRSYFQIKVARPSLFSKPVTPKLTPRASAWRIESCENIPSCFFSQVSIPDIFPVNQPFFQRCQVFKELVHHVYWCKKKVTIQYNAIQYNTIQYNTMQCNAMQCNAMQCNAMQYNYIVIVSYRSELHHIILHYIIWYCIPFYCIILHITSCLSILTIHIYIHSLIQHYICLTLTKYWDHFLTTASLTPTPTSPSSGAFTVPQTSTSMTVTTPGAKVI